MEFNCKQKKIVAPMGQVQVPAYANNVMAKKMDPKILALAKKCSRNVNVPMKILKRFLDDFSQHGMELQKTYISSWKILIKSTQI